MSPSISFQSGGEMTLRGFAKFGTALIGAVAIFGSVMACGSSSYVSPQEDGNGFRVYPVQVGSEKFNCVAWQGYREYSIDCDFSRPIR